ncbi:MAG: oxidoreductase, partial [SAR324 cluster bacterium]|nr:oxidoreductase [SAR324 cluster bacterium]
MIDQKTLEAFNTSLRGQLIQPGDEEYAEACKVYNGMIGRRPGMVVSCLNVADGHVCTVGDDKRISCCRGVNENNYYM